MRGKVFISYARVTRRRVQAIARALEAEGWQVWIDNQLISGRSFADEIQKALDASDAVLAVWSSAAVASDWVRGEATRANAAGKLVQIRIDDAQLPLPFDQLHCLDFSHWRQGVKDADWAALGESLNATAARSARAPAPLASPPPRRWRPALRRFPVLVGLATLLLVVATGLALRTWRTSRPTDLEPRIALSPFTPVDADAQTSAFAKRLTNEVAGVLNENIAGLAPPSASSSPPDADLGVGGTVEREGDTLRVRSYLEDPRAKVTLWSRQYEHPASGEDVLRTQVAVELSDNLQNAMEPLRQQGLKIDPRTLALWISANAIYRQGRIVADPRVVASAYQQVVDRAPNFANARGMVAQALALASLSLSGPEAAELRRRARAEAERAIRTDPTTAEGAYDALFFLARGEAPLDIARAEDAWLTGLSRMPNSVGGLMRLCELLLDAGRAKAALPYCEHAAALRPLGAAWGYRYARALAATGQTERADRAIDREVRLHPQHWWIRQARFRMKAFIGPPDDALALLGDPTQPPAFTAEETEALEAFLQARMSDAPRDVERAVMKLRQVGQRGQLNGAIVLEALVVLHKLDDAFEFAARGPQNLGAQQGGWLFDPGMEPAQRDPRFWPLAARTGLLRYWRTRGVWPDFCSEPGLSFDCAKEAARAMNAG